jgi:hypothetical protein
MYHRVSVVPAETFFLADNGISCWTVASFYVVVFLPIFSLYIRRTRAPSCIMPVFIEQMRVDIFPVTVVLKVIRAVEETRGQFN